MSCSLGRGRGAKRSPTARVTYSYNGNQPWPTHSPIYPPLLSYNQRLKALCFSYTRSLFATTSNKPGFETMFLYSGSGGVLPVCSGTQPVGKSPIKDPARKLHCGSTASHYITGPHTFSRKTEFLWSLDGSIGFFIHPPSLLCFIWRCCPYVFVLNGGKPLRTFVILVGYNLKQLTKIHFSLNYKTNKQKPKALPGRLCGGPAQIGGQEHISRGGAQWCNLVGG